MIKLTDLEVGTIFDALCMLKEHYCEMSEEELNNTLSGAKEQYLEAIVRLYGTFNVLAYDDGDVYINR